MFSVLFPRLLLIQISLHFTSNAMLQPRLEESLCICLQIRLFLIHRHSHLSFKCSLSLLPCSQIPDLKIPQGITPRLVRWRSRQERLLPRRMTWVPPSGLHCGRGERTDSLELPSDLHMWATTNISPPPQIINQCFVLFFKKNHSHILYLGESLSCIIKYTVPPYPWEWVPRDPLQIEESPVLCTPATQIFPHTSNHLCYS